MNNNQPIQSVRRPGLFWVLTLLLAILLQPLAPVSAQVAVVPPKNLNPLNQTRVPEPPNLAQFVKNKAAAIKLGKAFFWDMQTGSDGIQACASCHSSSFADNRVKNSINPGILSGDTTFQVKGPNGTLLPSDYPFHQVASPDDSPLSPVIRESNDITSSQGVHLSQFVGVVAGSAVDSTTPIVDPVFSVGGINTRRVEPRNTPTVINAVFNFTNFWDGRANFIFNGVNPFGPADTTAGIWFNDTGVLVKRPVAIEFASLASQAVGPPLSEFEMSARGRTFPELGHKMLSLRPLGKQMVHPTDSVLGTLSRAVVQPDGTLGGNPGLNTTYEQMIRDAFQDNLWASVQTVGITVANGQTVQFAQMEANFSLFWGLAIQLYEATLVSDQTPFDAWLAGNTTALTDQQKFGFSLFQGVGNCVACHAGIEFTTASVAAADFLTNADNLLLEIMFVSSGTQVVYDNGFNNVGVRPPGEDIGRAGTAPFTNPLTNQSFPLSFSALAELQAQNLLPFGSPILPVILPTNFPINANGSFKVPSLRNVELTAPYFHNGSVDTLDGVLDFYTRGSNFPAANINDLDPIIGMGNPLIQNNNAAHAAIIAFLQSLTDPRVENEAAPFDHPQLFIPIGHPGDQNLITAVNPNSPLEAADILVEVPAVGTAGRTTAPGNLTANAIAPNRVDLAWVDNSADETGFRIDRSLDAAFAAVTIFTVAPNITVFSDTTAPQGTDLFYRVSALGVAVASLPSNVVMVTTPVPGVPPAAPTNLVVTPVNPNQMDLTWIDNSDTEAGFRIERSPDSVTFDVIGTVGANNELVNNTVSFSDNTVAPGTTQFYRVFAFNAAGNSAATGIIEARIPPAPAAPTAPGGLTANASSPTQVGLNWIDSSNDEAGFRLERSGDGTVFTEIGAVGPGVNTFTDTTALPATALTYRVVAFNDLGTGTSQPATVTTPAVAPAAPSGLTAVALSSSQVKLDWTHPGAGITGFRVERSTNNFVTITTFPVAANTRTFTDTTAAQLTTYAYRVIAINGAINSPPSNVFTLMTPVATPAGGGGFGGGGGGGSGAGLQLNGSGLLGTAPAMDNTGKTLGAGELKTGDNKCALTIPADILIRNSTGAAVYSISAAVMETPPAPPPSAALVLAYEMGPTGVTFTPAVTMTLSYTDAQIPAGMSENSLYIATWDGSNWVKLLSTVDAAANKVTAPVNHFSAFALIAQQPPPTTVPPTTVPTTTIPPTTLPPTTSLPPTNTQPATTPPTTSPVTTPPVTTLPPTSPAPGGNATGGMLIGGVIGAALALGAAILMMRRPKKRA